MKRYTKTAILLFAALLIACTQNVGTSAPSDDLPNRCGRVSNGNITIRSGFGTAPSIQEYVWCEPDRTHRGYYVMVINVGEGGSARSGELEFEKEAPNGWLITCTNVTSDMLTHETATGPHVVTISNFTVVDRNCQFNCPTRPEPWKANDILNCSAHAANKFGN